MTNNWSKEVQEVSIPRRVLRGFRVGGAEALHVRHLAVHGFNTPEGVEGFSRLHHHEPGREAQHGGLVSIPRRVLRGFRGPDPVDRHGGPQGVSIPRRVLRGFRGRLRITSGVSPLGTGFNTPEGVEGFSRASQRAYQPKPGTVVMFQYPGGC